ncbi:uncharacterized protein LOC129310398 isoform X4 [Prosopis cineraria]|uniref:uncharacterized protein LOC129310398 isoform X4 n=1 Tax=Prosopis cineraria TaxID=364024 RepID=UPI00240F573C|nr:uncharacterized protein LOC129310398 isoform X4 [Prosopis cineraria]
MATELEELIGFLSSPSPQITKVAVDIVRGLTGSDDGLQSLAKYAKTVLPSLSQLLAGPKEVSEPAAEALVNLSQNSNLAAEMVHLGMIKTAMDVLCKPECTITRLLVMLLVNLTQLDAGSTYLLQQAGRKLLLDPRRGLLKQIIRQFDSNSSLRKKGEVASQLERLLRHFDMSMVRCSVFGTLRNCCFEAENQLQNLLLISEFLWPALLLPVAGHKLYSEQDTSKMPLELGTALSIEREPVTDADIRIQALEAIYLIVLQEAGRRAFWSVNGPRIIQIGYEDEQDPKVMEAYEQLGSLLIHSGGTEEPSSESAK